MEVNGLVTELPANFRLSLSGTQMRGMSQGTWTQSCAAEELKAVVHDVGINKSVSARLGMHIESIVDKREGLLGDGHYLGFCLEGAFVFEHYISDDAWITTSQSSARHIFSGQSFIHEVQ